MQARIDSVKDNLFACMTKKAGLNNRQLAIQEKRKDLEQRKARGEDEIRAMENEDEVLLLQAEGTRRDAEGVETEAGALVAGTRCPGGPPEATEGRVRHLVGGDRAAAGGPEPKEIPTRFAAGIPGELRGVSRRRQGGDAQAQGGREAEEGDSRHGGRRAGDRARIRNGPGVGPRRQAAVHHRGGARVRIAGNRVLEDTDPGQGKLHPPAAESRCGAGCVRRFRPRNPPHRCRQGEGRVPGNRRTPPGRRRHGAGSGVRTGSLEEQRAFQADCLQGWGSDRPGGRDLRGKDERVRQYVPQDEERNQRVRERSGSPGGGIPAQERGSGCTPPKDPIQ